MDIKIFVSHRIDKKSVQINNPLFYNVRCGADLDDASSDLLGDNTGDNISKKRLSYCELTVQYWAWKNIKADFYGFCHYRRYISFAERIYNENNVGVIEYPQIDKTAIERFKLDETTMRKEIEKHDIITNVSVPVKQSGDFFSVRDYCKKHPQGYKVEDIDILRSVIQEKYPQDLEFFDQFFDGPNNRWYNCYIMKANVFNDYATWLFDILFEFEKRVDISTYSQEQLRVFGVMAERLWGVYLLKLFDQKTYRICEKQLVYFKSTTFTPKPHKYLKDSIPIFIPIKKDRIPLAYVTVDSILKKCSSENFYSITCLHVGMKKEDLHSIVSMKDQYSNVEISELDVSLYVERYRSVLHMQIDEMDLISFSIFDVCKEYPKIIFLSHYMMILSDIAEVYRQDIGNKYAAASVDSFILLSCYQNQSLKNYFETELRQIEPWQYYNFNFCILNISQIITNYTALSFVKMANLYSYSSPFCDILNSKLYGKIDKLPQEWSVVADCDGIIHDHGRFFLPYEEYSSYLMAYKNPKAIYFSWFATPWTNENVDCSDQYWQRLRNTEFYEKALCLLITKKSMDVVFKSNDHFNNNVDMRSGVRKMADKIFPIGSRRRQLVKCLIPKNSLRWKISKQIYYIFRPQYRALSQ